MGRFDAADLFFVLAQKSSPASGAQGFLIRPQDGIPPSSLREQIITEMLKHPTCPPPPTRPQRHRTESVESSDSGA
jgi:hypothetical protein